MSSKKYCIVTPDVVGPVKNGGIGTHSFYLAKFWAEELKYEVTLIHTGCIEVESIQFWRKYYKSNFNIQFIHESELSLLFNGQTFGGRWFLTRSQRIYDWLKDRNFDSCHFQDWHANGFVSIQAKRTGQSFVNTTLTCMTHSSSEWIREGMQLFPIHKVDDLILDYMERYCMEYADYAISPSQYMFDWADSHGWNICKNRLVLPCLFNSNYKSPEIKEFDGKHIIFFGRLETRKGFEIFLQALNLLAPKFELSKRLVKITLLGKNGTTSYGSPEIALNQCLQNHLDIYDFSFISEMSHAEALNFLVENSEALVVIPSLVDNLPYAALECAALNLNVIASNVGGIPEIFKERSRLFTPTPAELANKIGECIDLGVSKIHSNIYSPEIARQKWKDFSEQLTNSSIVNKKFQNQTNLKKDPLISICIPYYNCGKYLPDLLISLAQQTYKNFEVIIVNDGSNNEFSLQVFEEMRNEYRDYNWKFLDKENGGIGNTRNLAASKSMGDYLVFVDADNACESHMLESMVKGIISSNTDCLTCYFRAFEDGLSPFSKVYSYAYTPIGGCVEAGAYENVFGDANFIIRKDSFISVGGFKEDRGTSYEDWDFLARLAIAGYQIDVIPDFLFLYRHTEDGFSRTTSTYQNHNRVLKAYFEATPIWNKRLISNSVGYFSHVQLNSHYQQTIEAMESSKFWKLRKIWFKFKRQLRLTDSES